MKKNRVRIFTVLLMIAISILPYGGLSESESACGFDVPTAQGEIDYETVVEAAAEPPDEISVAEPVASDEAELPADVQSKPEDFVTVPMTDEEHEIAVADGTDTQSANSDEDSQEPEAAFTGSIRIELRKDGEITTGDEVALKAVVTDANMAYTVQWEYRARDAKPEDPWTKGKTGEEYTFTATQATAACDYRACLTAVDQTKIISNIWNFMLKPAVGETGGAVDVEGQDTASVAADETSGPDEEIPGITETDDPEGITSEQAEASENTASAVVPQEMSTEKTEQPAETSEREELAVPEVIDSDSGNEDPVETDVQTEDGDERLNFNNDYSAADDECTIPDDAQTITLEKTGEETFEDVNVREDADGMSPIFTSLPEGAEIAVIGMDGDWATVVVDGQQGYIYIDDLQPYLDMTGEPEVVNEESTPEMKVTIFSSRSAYMLAGDEVTLTSRIEGFDGYEIMYQWECDRHDGSGFQNVEGANEDTYTFQASAETLSWDWRLSVYYR